jgi:DNA (cytosine-5)-methyltransferase 1
MEIKFIDLFAGIGGFRYGLESVKTQTQRVWKEDTETIRNGKNKSKAKGHEELGGSRPTSQQHTVGVTDRQFTCVYSNEWNKYAAQIYKKHFGECDERDITTVPASDIPDHDLLVGGFPCQAFSIAGKRRGFAETRGTLFFEIARILKAKQTKWFILENVKGLLSHNNGNTFKTIISTLTELGYDLEWQVLNSKNFGVPQNRERVFIIGHLRGTPGTKIFPIGEDDKLSDGENETKQRWSQAEISHALKGSNMKADNAFIVHNIYGGFGEQTNREFHDISPTIRTPKGGGHIPTVVNIVNSLKEKGLEPTEKGWESLDRLEKAKIRRLTPIECERLQGFPDNWTEGISDTQRYKCLGNAVTTNVITYLGEKLLNNQHK